MEKYTLDDVENILISLEDLSLLLNSTRKKIRQKANKTLNEIVLPKAEEIASYEIKHYEITSQQEQFEEFLSEYKSLINKNNIEANKLASKWLNYIAKEKQERNLI